MIDELGNDYHLVEEGLSGRTTAHSDPVEGEHKNGLAVLPALLESHMPIDYFVMMLGSNDLKARFAVTAFEISIGIQRLVQAVQRSGAGPNFAAPEILLISPPAIFERSFLAGMFKGGRLKPLALPNMSAMSPRSWERNLSMLRRSSIRIRMTAFISPQNRIIS